MAYIPSAYRPVLRTPQKSFWRDRYFRIVATILAVTLISSFYVYQRVWVRRLVNENELILKQTENARLYLARLQEDWARASSLTNIEMSLQSLQLDLKPTLPAQNVSLPLDLTPDSIKVNTDPGKYAGIVKALDKVKNHIPLIESNDAEAKGIPQGK
jgi:hypothetical protein